MFYIPGCDVFKEAYPHPYFNYAHQRGMHIFSFEGPGQAECNLRGIKLTADNFEQAASAALDYSSRALRSTRSEAVLYSNSFGSFWGMRIAATTPRFKAVAATQASICEKYIQTDLESPRWKQLMAFLTQCRVRGRARPGHARHDHGRLHGEDQGADADDSRRVRPARAARRDVPAVRPDAAPRPSCG